MDETIAYAEIWTAKTVIQHMHYTLMMDRTKCFDKKKKNTSKI